MHYMAIFEWLVANNLFKATIAFCVTVILGGLLTLCCRPWKAYKHRKQLQERIADSLDTRTPGGLTELVHRLDKLLHDEANREDGEDEEGDDNGTDPHGGKMTLGHAIPDVHDIHGGGSAGHR
jgi:hypothetical protein